MTVLLYPGSFDPFTRGHAAVVITAAKLGHVIVGVATNTTKRYLFSDQERIALARDSIAEVVAEQGISISYEVVAVEGLVAHWAREHGVNAIVKGIRAVADTDSEIVQAHINARLDAPPTVFVPAGEGLQAVSSTVVKEIAGFGGDISWLVTQCVASALQARL